MEQKIIEIKNCPNLNKEIDKLNKKGYKIIQAFNFKISYGKEPSYNCFFLVEK